MPGLAGKPGVAMTLFLVSTGLITASGRAQPTSPSETKTSQKSAPAPDHAGSYYHYMLAMRYEELAGIYNRSEDIDHAVSEFKQAIADDPTSLYLHAGLGDLYWRAGMLTNAVDEAQYVLKKNPNDLDAHKLLGNIYLHNLGSNQGQPEQKQDLEKAIHEYEAIMRLAPTDTHSAVLLGRLYWLDNQTDKAEATFKKVAGAHPDSASALDYLGKLMIDQEHYKEAIGVFERIPDNQRGPATLALMGLAYSKTGAVNQALKSYKDAVDLDPENADVRRQYADALLEANQVQPARAQLEQVIKSNPQDGMAYLRLAQLDQAQGRFSDAEKELAQARNIIPNDPEVAYEEALVQDAQGNDDKAIQLLETLLSSTASPDGKYSGGEATNRAIFLSELGTIYRKERKYDQAIATFRQITALGNDQGPRGEGLIIETLQAQGQKQKALGEASEALLKYPKNRQLTMVQASLLGESGHVDEAVQELRSLEKGNADPAVELRVAEVYNEAKRYREAEDAVRQVLDQASLKPGDHEYAEFVLGAVYEHQKKYGPAEEQFKRVLTTDPANAEAYNYLGYMLADRGIELDQSVEYIKKALQIDPNNAAYLDSLGWAYYKMARYDLALAPLQKAAKMLNTDPTVLAHLGHVYLKLGKEREAADEWRQALKEWPASTDSDFDATEAAKLQKSLSQVEHHLAKNDSKD
ncbi:MAG TPA: tetratricopeptide repeat protein [Terriglobia bacterium]|nr:tetratricopeptide repeat protein [Terriglobia bacterium]